MAEIETLRSVVDTVLFGNIVVERTEDRVTACSESDGSIVVSIERTGPRTRKKVPIGTRRGDRLVARLNDREVKISPGSGRFLKRAFRISAELDGRTLSLRPSTVDTVMFIGGKPYEVEKSFCELTARADGVIDVVWAVPQTIEILGRTVEPPVPTAEDLLIGFALAAAFGTGALSIVSVFAELVAAAVPG